MVSESLLGLDPHVPIRSLEMGEGIVPFLHVDLRDVPQSLKVMEYWRAARYTISEFFLASRIGSLRWQRASVALGALPEKQRPLAAAVGGPLWWRCYRYFLRFSSCVMPLVLVRHVYIGRDDEDGLEARWRRCLR